MSKAINNLTQSNDDCMVQDDPILLGDSGEVPIYEWSDLTVRFLLWNLLFAWQRKLAK